MNVEDAKRLHAALQRQILVLVQDFERVTDCRAYSVDLIHEQPMGSPPSVIAVKVEVRL